MIKCPIAAWLLLILVCGANAGTLTVTTSPAYATTSGTNYLPISNYKAANSGVTFSSTAAHQVGSVTAWLWTFANADALASGAYSQQNPGMVTWGGAEAYGNKNACTVGVTHTGISGVICASDTNAIVTVDVNVIEPTLAFNTTGGFASGDTAVTKSESDYKVTYTMQLKAEYSSKGVLWVGCPYEYEYTVDPFDAGPLSTDMAIYETNSITDAFYQGSTQTSSATYSASPAFYNPNGYYNYDYSYTSPVTDLTNPIMYAFDVPAVGEVYYQSQMKANVCNKYVCTKTLTSYPLFQDSSAQHLDDSTKKSHTFVETCTSASTSGTGPYTWNVSY